ncbi:MAG: hypothetical protein QOF33_1043 [Thermomicrobiales bacterium]|jgi:hypothetical protein|nr:hypothetical protein [Thermomicrobiales bacterium]
MPQPYDIELDGAGYMIAPGTYRRVSDGMPEGRTGRVVVKDFVGGQRQALQLARDRSWDSDGVGPAMMGQGVEPWPYTTFHGDGVLPAITRTSRTPSIVTGGYVWVGKGTTLYKSVALTATSWASFQADKAVAGTAITDLAVRSDQTLYVLYGGSGDIRTYDLGGAASAIPVLRAGRKGDCGVGYAGMLIFGGQDGSLIRMDDGTNQDSRQLDGVPRRMALHDGRVAIVTRTGSLWLLSGKWDSVALKWSGEPEPLFTHGVYADDQDYIFLVSFGGRLYTWLQGQVLEYNPSAGSSRQGWRTTGLEGRSCYGATVAANMLVVAIVSRDGVPQLWAWDGSGWWLMESVPGGQARCWPVFLAGAGNLDLLAFRDGNVGVNYSLFRMAYRDATNHNYNASGQWVSSLLDAGERDKTKAWRKIGCTFAAPQVRGNAASNDAVTVALSYSTDGGTTFTTAVSTAVSDPANRTLDLEANLASAAAVSRFLMLRVSFSSVLDWAPVLTGVWAEYELLDAPAKRRKWSFKVHAHDATVQRDGSVATRTGRQLAADLWADWSAGNTVAFKDVDYDAATTTYQVRIVGIAEEVAKPSDGGRWGESTLALTLVEV